MFDVNRFEALVLNADFTPVSISPLEVWPAHKAVHAATKGRIIVVEEYDQIVHSANITMRLPAVIAFKRYISQERPAPYNRANLYVRDNGCCQYCGAKLPMDEMTVDHVHPQSKGGQTVFKNTTVACDPCNLRKADKSLGQAGMGLHKQPFHPTLGDLNRSARKLKLAHIQRKLEANELWRPYLEA